MLTFNLNKLSLPNESKILDVGCGEGRHIFGSLQKFQNDWRIRLNDLGANIGELRDWITRQHHDTDKMANASRHSKIIGDNRFNSAHALIYPDQVSLSARERNLKQFQIRIFSSAEDDAAEDESAKLLSDVFSNSEFVPSFPPKMLSKL